MASSALISTSRPQGRPQLYSDLDLMLALSQAVEILGDDITRTQFDRQNGPIKSQIIVRRLGAWNKARTSARLIGALVRASQTLGHSPSAPQFNALNLGVKAHKIVTYFGSWNTAKQIAGLATVKQGQAAAHRVLVASCVSQSLPASDMTEAVKPAAKSPVTTIKIAAASKAPTATLAPATQDEIDELFADVESNHCEARVPRPAARTTQDMIQMMGSSRTPTYAETKGWIADMFAATRSGYGSRAA